MTVRRFAALAAALVALVGLGFGAAAALAETTGVLSVCATAQAPVAVNGTTLTTVSANACTTTTYTIPTVTVTAPAPTTTGTTTTGTTTTTPTPTYLLDDEFNGPAGSLPSPSVWDFKGNGSHARWGKTSNVSENGNGDLVITATCAASCATASNWTSGFISSAYAPALTGSYHIEVSAKIPCGQGVWPAPVWTWGYPWGTGGTPTAPVMENDVIEQLGSSEATSYHTTLHNWNGTNPHPQTGHRNETGATLCNAFHTYAANVYPDRVDYLLDGTLLYSIASSSVSLGDLTTQKQAANIDLDMGGWAGTIGASSPQTMLVDYIRVSQL